MISKIDEFDIKILDLLKNGGFRLKKQIRKETGLSRFSINKRINKLFRLGIIHGSTIVINPFALGKKNTIFFEFKTNPNEPWIAKCLAKIKNCETLLGITGEYSLFSRFKFTDDDQFKQELYKIDELVSRSDFKKYHFFDVIRTYKEDRVIFNEKANKKISLDCLDYKILQIMQNQKEYVDGPQSLTTTEVSRILTGSGIPISQPSIFRRLDKMRRGDVILGDSVDLDYYKLRYQTKLILKLKVNPIFYDKTIEKLVCISEITDVYRTSEDYAVLTIVQVRSVHEYNEFLIKLYDSKHIIDTYSTLILEERHNKGQMKL